MPKNIESEEKNLKTKKMNRKGKATENKSNETTKIATNSKKSVKSSEIPMNKKVTNKKVDISKRVTNEKVTNKKTNISKRTTNKKVTKNSEENLSMVTAKNTKPIVKAPEFLQEYYDLPYRYNETIVTILAQTPKRLFVYWDVSDKDRESYKKAFGDDFFEKTYPVLLVHNEELNYTFEVPINDFANSWYLDIQDSKTNYVVKLGRKFRNANQAKNVDYDVIKEENINLQNDFIYITDSNKLESPNDHILFELLSNSIKYRNVKNGKEFTKDLKDLLGDMNGVYPSEAVHKLYMKLYEDEIAKEDFGRRNPGSEEFGLPTSSGTFGIPR